jgi:hypothetical protein
MVEETLHLGVRKQERLNTTVLDDIARSSRMIDKFNGYGKEAVVTSSKCCRFIYLKRLRTPQKNLDGISAQIRTEVVQSVSRELYRHTKLFGQLNLHL